MSSGGRTVLVTGATGFVGSAVTCALLDAGHDVVGLVRSPGRARGLVVAGARVAVGDMRDPESYLPLVDDADAVVHAAQLTPAGRVTASKVRRLNAANTLMTGALARRCLRDGKRFVYTGGCFVYGDHGADWIDESTPLSPSPMGEGDAAEIRKLRELHESGLDSVVISPGFVYGPGSTFKDVFYESARRGRLRCPGPGTNYWSCVHVEDLAAAYALALTGAPAGAEYAVVDDEPLTLRSMLDRLAAAMGGTRVGKAPPPAVRLLAGRPAAASLLTSYRVRNAKARRELGWAPRYATVDEGLPPTLDALREGGEFSRHGRG
ncbi:NAD-dependent epimerase/dehydratase family protein [Actinomadura viridis]|uniref:NAD-dependent epimerase/dehydratase family protein n=1 Tax=Actinomadura viridis TaxID=58110 RepID=UPI003685AF15